MVKELIPVRFDSFTYHEDTEIMRLTSRALEDVMQYDGHKNQILDKQIFESIIQVAVVQVSESGEEWTVIPLVHTSMDDSSCEYVNGRAFEGCPRVDSSGKCDT